jgi:hypothetical protein
MNDLPLRIRIRILLTKIQIFIIKCISFNKAVVIGVTVNGGIFIDKKGGIVANCVFEPNKE